MKRLNQVLNIKSKNYLKIVKLLTEAGAQVRLVGGVVRDTLLGWPTKDIDMATDFKPLQVISVLEAHGVKVIPTGIKFGTVSALINKEVFEITTLRKDLSCDGRHADVVYSNDFREDAQRRDFTINSLSYCPIKHEIYDYFGGVDDLNNRRVIFIGTADERIQEDYLRILRFFRFSCKYANKIDEEGLAACVRFKDTLRLLSGERIKHEMDTMLSLERSPYILATMYNSEIMQVIFPVTRYDQVMHIKAINIAKDFNISLDLGAVYAILFSTSLDFSPNSTSVDDCGIVPVLRFSRMPSGVLRSSAPYTPSSRLAEEGSAKDLLKKLLELKFSRAEALLVIKLLQLKKTLDKGSVETLLKVIWHEEKSFLSYFVLASVWLEDNKIVYDLLANLKNQDVPKFPVDGNDLIKLGYRGETLGKLIKSLKYKWIQSDFALNKEEIINLVKNCEI